MVLGPPEKIDKSKDYVLHCQCGCRVTFFRASGYMTSRMDACIDHNKRDQTAIRDRIMDDCKLVRDYEFHNQPPQNIEAERKRIREGR